MTATNERMTITVTEAAELLGIGRTLAYRLASSGELPGVVRIGRSLRVSRPVLLRWLGVEESRANGHGRPPATTPDEV